MKKMEIDFSDKIKASKVLCDCKKGYEEKGGKCVPVAESSWKKKKKY